MIKLRIGKKEFVIDDEYYNIETFGVFGSFTTGDFDEYSDINFFVVLQDDMMNKPNITSWAIGNSMGVPGSWISLYTKSQLENLKEKKSFWCWIMKVQLKVLYSRSNYIFHYFDSLSTEDVDIISYMKYHSYKINYMLERYNTGLIFMDDLLEAILSGIRGGCMVLCYIHGLIDVGKYSSVARVMSYDDIKVSFNMREFRKFYNFVSNNAGEHGNILCPRRAEQLVMIWYNRYRKLYGDIWRYYNKAKTSDFYNILPKIKTFNRLQKDKEQLDCCCICFRDVQLISNNGN